MVRPGDKVFLVCKGETDKIRIKGTVVEEVDDDNLVVGIDPDIAKKVSNSLLSEKSGGSPPLGFIKVPVDSVSSVLPAGWENATGGQAPKLSRSEDSEEGELSRDSGMKAVVTLNKLHRKVKHHPKQIIRRFEKELLEEMGVVPGQAWSIRDWLKRQPWGKFKGIYRTAVQDAAVYELLRSGETDQATAQLVQNMKSKLQSVLSGGDWATAWLMTGLPDPLSRKEWAGNKEEMAVISGYMNSLNRLKKKMKEAGTTANEDQE